jgi:hypothetical protein
MRPTLLVGGWVVGAATILACAELAPPEGLPEPERPPASGVPYIAGELMQGRHILGSAPEAWPRAAGHLRFHVDARDPDHATYRVGVTAASEGVHLTASLGVAVSYVGADPWLHGMVLQRADGPGQIRIRDSLAIPLRDGEGPQRSRTQYLLDFDPGTGVWADYCGDGRGAYAMIGHYTEARIHALSVAVTFVCEDGVGGKCIDWGYPPGSLGPRDPDWARHQACTAAANFDVCRTGVPGTRELTPIVLRDFAGSPYPAPTNTNLTLDSLSDPDRYTFEAAWRGGAALPLCVSKARWATLPPAPCGAALPDPRLSDSSSVRFCDDYTYAELEAAGALLVTGSKVMDAPLHTWRRPAADVVGTMRGYATTEEEIPPFSGYTEYLGTGGMVLRNLPGSIDPSTMIALWLWIHATTGDRVIGPTAPNSDYVNGGRSCNARARPGGPPPSGPARAASCWGT